MSDVKTRVARRALPAALLLMFVSAVAVSAVAQEPYSAESVTAKADAYLPQSLVDGLNPVGSRLVTTSNGLPVTVCEVWWAKSVSTQKSSDSSKEVLYGNLRPGELVGVIHFMAQTSEDYREDFRDQKLRAGYYTMRYAIMPKDSEHKDVNPYRDFVVLSPVSVDRDPNKELSMEELMRSSHFASRSKHPAIMSLVPADPARKEAVAVRTDDTGGCVLQVHLHTRAAKGEMAEQAVAIVLVTPSKENGAS